MDKLEFETIKLLRELGIQPHLKGYAYIKTAVSLLWEKPELIYSIVKGLYTAVAKEYGSEPSRVERGIRHAVDIAECDISVRLRLLNSVDHIPNSRFLATIVEELRVRMSTGVPA